MRREKAQAFTIARDATTAPPDNDPQRQIFALTMASCDITSTTWQIQNRPQLRLAPKVRPHKRGALNIKRSTAIRLIVLGTGAAAIVAATQPRVCHDENGNEVDCRSTGARSGAGYLGRWSSARRSASRSTISRSGFGSTGRSSFSGG
jgi:hypothetical protein